MRMSGAKMTGLRNLIGTCKGV